MIGAVAYQIGFDKVEYPTLEYFLDHSIWNKPWFTISVMMVTATFVLLPLYLLKDISKLRFSTILGLICLTIAVLAIIIQLPSFLIQNADKPDVKINWYDMSGAFESNFYFFKGTATIFFAFNCHYGAFAVYDKLADNNKRRARKVIYRSVVLDSIFFVIVGVCGYLTQPKETPALVVNRNSLDGDESDILMTICRVLIFGLLCVKLPVNYNSMRLSIFNLFWKTTEITTGR